MAANVDIRPTPQLLVNGGGEPLIFHCNHYNRALQRCIEDAGTSLDAQGLLRDAGVPPVYAQMKTASGGARAGEVLEAGAAYFKDRGFGLLDIASLNDDGGTVTIRNSHYALAFASREGARRETSACHFAAGFVEGLATAAFGSPLGSYVATETKCGAIAEGPCTFDVKRAATPRALTPSVGMGAVVETLPTRPTQPTNHIDEAAIMTAVSGLPLAGNEEGCIPAFGVYLTLHYANYYNEVSYELERRLTEKQPHLAGAAREVLVEAGHVCAFHTFGGIMTSVEWEALVLPMVRGRTDWVFGMVAVINCLGWGRWTITELVENKRLVMRIDGSYESNHFVARYGTASEGKCYLCQGGVAGLMNLLYVGDVPSKPALTPAYYEKLFSGPESFRSTETKCRSKGDDHCEVVAERVRYEQ